MISIKEIHKKDIELCIELDSNTMSLWNKNQWESEFRKEEIRVFGLFLSNLVIGICVVQVVLDEAQINFFAVSREFRKRGFGSCLMSNLIKICKELRISKLLLEVSQNNVSAEKFYRRFDFLTVGIRRNYYKDGSNALLKEKILGVK